MISNVANVKLLAMAAVMSSQLTPLDWMVFPSEDCTAKPLVDLSCVTALLEHSACITCEQVRFMSLLLYWVFEGEA